MRILYHHRVRSKDGQYVHVEELVAALRAAGHDVAVVGPPSTERDAFGCEGGAVDALKRALPPAVYEAAELAYGALPFLRLMRSARRRRPDVIYERYALHLLAGLWTRRLTGVPLILEVNAPLARERAEHGRLRLVRLAAAVQRAAWRGADAVLAVTESLAEEVIAAGVPEERVVVVPNGVNAAFGKELGAEAAAVRRRLDLEDAVVLGFSGFVRDWHGLDWAVDLLADPMRRPDLRLLVVGDGPAVPGLRERAAALGVEDRVRFAGIVARERMPAHVAAMDVALQPRAVPYACPLKLLEYMAAGRAIVAPDQPNVKELVGEGAARLFAPDDAFAFRRAATELAADQGLRERLGRAARAEIARCGLTWKGSAEKVIAVARRIASGRAPRTLETARSAAMSAARSGAARSGTM